MTTKKDKVAVAYLRRNQAPDQEGFERQLDACYAYAKAHSLTLGRIYADTASGMATAARPELDALLDAAADRLFDTLVIAAPDRLSREHAEMVSVFKRLDGHGVAIHDARHGRLRLRDITFHGLLADKGGALTKERASYARQRMAQRGIAAGSPTYGYRTGPGGRGDLVVFPAQAEVVRKAFALCLKGMSHRQIAMALNQMAVKDTLWSRITVAKVLRKDLYDGRQVHGRWSRLRDPGTGRIVVTHRPREEWGVVAVEHLRIVAHADWLAVQTMLKAK